MLPTQQSALYVRTTMILTGLIAFFFIIYIGQDIILPLVFSVILAILLNPAVTYLTRKKFNRVLAIFIVEIFALLVLAGFIIFMGSQLTMFGDSFPQLREKFNALIIQFVHWAAGTFRISTGRVNKWIDVTTDKGMENSTLVLSYTINTLKRLLVNIFLIPVYIFMLLFYKALLLKFISKIFPSERHEAVVEVLMKSKGLIQSYLIGLLVEAGIVATLNSVSLLLIGIDYAVLLGIICALLNIIPYIGGIIAVIITMLYALMTKSSVAALLVFIAHLTIQFIDNNYLVPKVVAKKVKINALASIIVVLIGGALCGIPGMFLSIPITAIVKVICDRIERLEPIGFLLGDNMPPIGKEVFKVVK